MNDSVYIIGGGNSLTSFPFHKLENKETIVVNEAALDVPNPTYCITADSGIFRKVQNGYFKNIDTTWVLVTNPNHCTMQFKKGQFINIKNGFVYNLFAMNIIIKNAGVEGIGFSFKNFKTGYNSGFCAFQLAVLLGYKKIFLLGMDLISEAKKHHYHNRYNEGKHKIQSEMLELFYNNWVIAFDEIKRKTDIEVFSCSKVSRLNKHIPYVSFGDIA